MSKKYCLISHTHWDREWYLPFENFRMRLVDLIDHLLDILETDRDYRFHLDAQTIVLDDYLDIRPYRKSVLEKHIREGRILVGPWYVQNDFHLTSGEATVRNLLIGTRMANEFGRCMSIGYAADQFGLISQLPQILARFGLDNCVFGRGFDRHVTEFFWESEDGSRILCEHMRFWYNNAQRLSPDPEGALRLLRQCGKACAAHCAGSNYLLMNGVDHLEAQEDLTEIMEKVRPMLDPDEEVFQDTLPEFIRRVRAEVEENGIELKTFRGEFRDNGADNVLTGTLSSRVNLKQMNVRAQADLEKKLEPLYTMLSVCGVKDYPQDYLYYLWKLLIQNHPHDSICGCSVDDVHRHMADRYARIRENTSELLERGVRALNSHLSSEGLVQTDCRILLLNGSQLADGRTVSAVADIPENEDTGSFVILDMNGNEITFVVEKIEKHRSQRILSPINLPGESIVNRYHLRIDAGTVEGVGYRTLLLRLREGTLAVPEREGNPRVMENDSLRCVIHDNGTVTLTDRRSGRVWSGLLAVEDMADRGHSYVYIPGDPASRVTSENVTADTRIVTENEFTSSRRISYTLDIDRPEGSGTIDVTLVLTLDKYGDELDVEFTLNNNVKRHRTRVLFPTGLVSETNYAGQPYDCIVRDKVSRFRNDATHPNTDFVGIEDETYGLAVLQEGLYEYEQCTDERNTLALTLLRSTGIITDGMHAEETISPGWLSPEGFMIGETTGRFAVVPYAGTHIDAQIPARSARFLSPVKAVVCPVDYNKLIGGRPFVQGPGMPDLFYRPLENADIVLPAAMTFVRLTSSPANAMVLSAVKRTEDGKSVLVRFYNSASAETAWTLETDFAFGKAESAMLNEDAIAVLPVTDGRITGTAAAKEIVTVRITL